MVAADSNFDRHAARDKYKAHCEKMLEERETNMKVVYENKKENVKIWGSYNEDGLMETVEICENTDLDLQDLRGMFYPIQEYVDTCNRADESAVTSLLKILDEPKEEYLMFIDLKLPWPMSNRIGMYYMFMGLDDGSTDVYFSEGTQQYHDEYKEKIGDKVIMDFKFIYTKFTPRKEGKGFTYEKVQSFALNGSVPKTIVNWANK